MIKYEKNDQKSVDQFRTLDMRQCQKVDRNILFCFVTQTGENNAKSKAECNNNGNYSFLSLHFTLYSNNKEVLTHVMTKQKQEKNRNEIRGKN